MENNKRNKNNNSNNEYVVNIINLSNKIEIKEAIIKPSSYSITCFFSNKNELKIHELINT